MRSRLLQRRLRELLVFEVAARVGSFSASGRELGMTQSAVSHHVANLEAELGLKLFERLWRGVGLTEAGEALADDARRAFATLDSGLASVRALAGRRSLTIATDFGFASFWLIPHLEELRRVAGGIDIQIVTSQTGGSPEIAVADAVIAFGAEPPQGWTVTRLVDEDVVPVASPFLIERLGLSEPADLGRARLLHLDTPHSSRWLSWSDYFRRFGADGERGGPDLSFNNYPLLIQAAIAGQGLALGWRPLVDDLIERGFLATLPGRFRMRERGYDLLIPRKGADNPLLLDFRRWLAAAFEKDPAPLGTAGGDEPRHR